MEIFFKKKPSPPSRVANVPVKSYPFNFSSASRKEEIGEIRNSSFDSNLIYRNNTRDSLNERYDSLKLLIHIAFQIIKYTEIEQWYSKTLRS